MTELLLIALGVALLTAGGELLIRGALAAARRLGVSPLLSGLVIVGFGTSAPELVVSVNAALARRPDIAIGNVVGSNIGNVLLILGVCALITPLTVKPLALRRDAVAVVAASVLFIVLVAGSALARPDGVVLLGMLAAYLVWAYVSERTLVAPAAELHLAEEQALTALPHSGLAIGAAVAAGLILLVAGAESLLNGAVALALDMGLSEAVVGLTLVAVGTSLPEFSISLIAAIRGQADVAVGNVLGSNVFNLLGILGVSALLQPLPVTGRIIEFDQWVMLAAALLLLVFLHTGRRLSRLEGGILLLGYVGYLGYSLV
ncbi:MAG: calcium/sodium antiporter [Pseudomonadales bacterium]